jgi:RimJ/RimL family protein N-acetyltransferase
MPPRRLAATRRPSARVLIASAPVRPRRHRRRESSGAGSVSTATIAASVAEHGDVRSPQPPRPADGGHGDGIDIERSEGPLHRLTTRLSLTPIGPDHADELWRLHQDPGIAEWYGGPLDRDAARELAARMAEGWRRDGVHKWIAHDRATGELVGRGGMSVTDLDGARVLEVGWYVRSALWGRGYATEIGRESLRFAAEALGADRVVAFTEVHNTRSRAVMERLGMRYDGEIRRPGLVARHPGVHPDASFALYVAELGTAG